EQPYKGILYCGLMITSEGPEVVEFNCRFGDPECQAIVPSLESDLLELMQAAAHEELYKHNVEIDTKHRCCVYWPPEGIREYTKKAKKLVGWMRCQMMR